MRRPFYGAKHAPVWVRCTLIGWQNQALSTKDHTSTRTITITAAAKRLLASRKKGY